MLWIKTLFLNIIKQWYIFYYISVLFYNLSQKVCIIMHLYRKYTYLVVLWVIKICSNSIVVFQCVVNNF